MSLRNHNHGTSHAKKSPDATTSALRNWFDRRHLNQSDTSDSNTEKDESSGERKLLSINLNKMLRTRQLLINFDAGRPVVSLKAPLDLINFQSIIRPRWPVECEVISDAIHHIEWDPSEPEPFYQPTGLEKASMPAGEEKGKVVYCVDHTTKYPHFTCSRIGGSRGPIRNATFIGEADSTLQFESRFESGNLLKAVQVGLYEYELTLRPDMYTAKHTQWFYFRVRNMKAGANYCFTIVNLMKSSSLYSVGMRPLLYSERAAKETSVGWRRTGSNIRYFRSWNQVKSSDTVTLHSLTWTVQFPYDSDTCYLAHCYPYTYSHLQRYLRGVASNPAITSYCMLRVLCHSLAGNAVYVLTVTSRGSSVVEDKTKRAVVVTARVHPGETNGSWMMEGFLEFLLGESDDARLLRDTFVFKVVPMLNPDGVIVGNYRCSLAGRDLNRNYKTRLRDSFPTVWHTRNMVERLVNETDVVLYCDFHGHNRKNNVFMYGCSSPGDNALKLQERVFPLMMSKNANNKFSFKSCKFRVQKSKEGTGRITMWRLGVKNSYTMEASFGGSTLGDRKGSHFTTRDLKSIGFYFCDTLLDYCDPDPTKIKYCLAELKVLMRKQVREKLGIDVGSGVTVSDVETSTSGSNSSDSNGLPVHLLKQQQSNQTLKKKKKRLRTFKERNRLRPERLRSATQPTALQSNFNSATLQESSSHLDNPERIHQKTGIRCGKNSQVRAGNLHTTQRGDVSQVTLWRGCKPVMNKGSCLEEMKTACRDDRGVESRSRCRCSGQMQHLSAPLPPSAKFTRASQQQQLPSLQHSFTSHKNCRGQAPALIDPHSSPMSLKMIPTKCLLSALTTDKFGMQRRLGDRNTSGVFEHYSLEDSPTIKTKLNDKEQEKDSAGLTESKSHTNLFVPVLRSRPPRAALLCKDKGCVNVLLPVLKPSVLDKMVHPRSVTLNQLQGNHGRRHQSGRGHRAMTAPQAPSGRRASQPALL